MTNPFLSLAVLDTNLDFSGAKNPNPYCAQIRSQGSRRRICPHRLAVPENIFALLACSIFSTAAGAPPRCIRHWRRSAPHPRSPPRCGGGVGGAEPSAAGGGCSEAEHPQRSKRTSKRAARSSFRVPQGGGGKYAVATFGAHLCAVRICFSRLLREKQYSYSAQLSVKGVCQGGIRPP